MSIATISTAMILIAAAVGLGIVGDTIRNSKPFFFKWLWHIFFGGVFLLILGVWLAAFGL